jgi:pimeloyl-ACP methyl ester carboxylesterase
LSPDSGIAVTVRRRSVLHLPELPSHVAPSSLFPAWASQWRYLRGALRRLQPVVGSTVVALPGYGAPRNGASTNPTSLSARLLRQLDSLHVKEAVLLAHSASCQIVAEAAVRAPDRIVGLVLVGSTTGTAVVG